MPDPKIESNRLLLFYDSEENSITFENIKGLFVIYQHPLLSLDNHKYSLEALVVWELNGREFITSVPYYDYLPLRSYSEPEAVNNYFSEYFQKLNDEYTISGDNEFQSICYLQDKIKVALKFFMKKKYLGEVDEILRKNIILLDYETVWKR